MSDSRGRPGAVAHVTKRERQANLMETLRHVERRLRRVPPDDVYELCAVVRRALGSLAPVDAFYVGLYAGDRVLFIPYAFSDGIDLGADTSRYGQHGLSAWIRAAARPYRFRDDNGKLIHRGSRMGEARASQDAVAVPMFDPQAGHVMGMLNAQSYQADAFDDVAVVGLESLAKALMAAMRVGASEISPPILVGGEGPSAVVEILESALERLDEVVDRVDGLLRHLTDPPSGGQVAADPAVFERAEEIRVECRRASAELTMMAVRATDQGQRQCPEATLTSRELEIAELIATESLSNGELARRLTISEKTVKTHVSNILTKLGIRQRSELTWLMNANGADPGGARR